MITMHTQAADPKDLKALTAGHGSLPKNLLVALAMALAIGLALYALSRSVWSAVAMSLALFLASAYSNLSFFRRVRQIEVSPEAAVECIEVEASHIVDLQPQGSNGPALAFLTERGECLLLVGQWLLEQKKFPSRHLRVYRWRADGEPIRTESLGPKEKPQQSSAGLKAAHRVVPIQIFAARLDSLEHDLDLALSAPCR